MKVRSVTEIQSLDDELNLFEESEWDFMSIVDTRGNNYEYFNDIRDDDFEFRKTGVKDWFVYVACGLTVLTLMVMITLKVTNFFDDSEWRELNNMQSVYSGNTVSYISGGEEASPEDLISISNLLSSYTRCLQAKGNYGALDDYCVDGSKFRSKYYGTVDNVETIYDVNDCYARGIREFGSYYKVLRINRVIVKDGVFYCYANVEFPTIYDVSEFVQTNNQSFVLKFQGGGNVNEASVAKFLLEVIEENYVPRTTSEVCIQLSKTDSGFKMVDDSFILSVCNDDYSVAVNQVLTSLGSLVAGNRE